MIPELSVPDAIARLDAEVARAGDAGAALATDGDGTLWTKDVGEALFAHLLEHRLIGPAAREALLAEADVHEVVLADRDDPVGIARRLFDAYVKLAYPEDRMCAAMAWCVAGTTESALDTICVEVLEKHFALRTRVIPESLAILRWAAERSVPVWLVSASPRAVVVRAAAIVAELATVPRPQVIAMTPKVDGGVIEPSLEGIWPYGEGKRTALGAVLGARTLVGAMGDNVFDVPMLGAARVPLAIRPKPALLNAAAQVPLLSRLGSLP